MDSTDSTENKWLDRFYDAIVNCLVFGIAASIFMFWYESRMNSENLAQETRLPIRVSQEYNYPKSCFDIQAYNPSPNSKRGVTAAFYSLDEQPDDSIDYVSMRDPSNVNVKTVILDGHYGTGRNGKNYECWEGPVDFELDPDEHYSLRVYVVDRNLKSSGYLNGELDLQYEHANGELAIHRIRGFYVFAVADRKMIPE